MFEDFKVEWIEELNRIGKQTHGIFIKLPSLDKLLMAQAELNKILSEDKQADLAYTLNISMAMRYAQTQFHYITGDSLLDDIKAGKHIYTKDYIAIRPNSDKA